MRHMTTSVAVVARDASTSRAALPAGHIPAVVYGPKQEPISISVEEKTFDKIRKEAGESTILELTGLVNPIEVLIKHIDFASTRVEMTHVDFYAIERGKAMTVTVGIEFTGVAPAEKNGIGSVTKAMQEIEVTCLPRNLPAEITVDVSVLVDAHSKITVADLPALEGVTYEAELTDAVAVISVAKEEADADPEEVDMAAVAVAGAKTPAEPTE
jgi:large subunit ribosomal protein L25